MDKWYEPRTEDFDVDGLIQRLGTINIFINIFLKKVYIIV